MPHGTAMPMQTPWRPRPTAPRPGPRTRAAEILRDVALAPSSVDEALRSLVTVAERLRERGDRRAVFPDVYAVITRRVSEAIRGRRLFLEPSFISRLAGRFCELYLAALRRSLDGEREPSSAWSRADREIASPSVLPVQHAMLGLNAHINYDLAQGLFATLACIDTSVDAARMERYRHDHDAVNIILGQAMPEAIEILAERYECPVARVVMAGGEVRHALEAAVLFTLRVWRTRVWADLKDLLAAPDAAEAAHVTARMDLRSGLIARALAVPVPAVASRHAPFCAAA